jgi:hypothetical protein
MDFFKYFYLFRWLKDCSRGMSPSIHSINRASVRHFGFIIKRFLKGRETLDPQVSNIHKASVRSFGCLTMRFFNGLETLGWRIQGFRCATFLHWLLENVIFQRFMRPSDQGYLAFIGIQLSIMSLKPPFQANWLHVNHCSHFGYLKMLFSKVYETLRSRLSCFQLHTIKYYGDLKNDSLIPLRLSAEGYVANCERIIGIFVA